MKEEKSEKELIMEVFKMIFPKDMFEYFSLRSIKEEEDMVYFNFEERNIVPEECVGRRVESKGFYTTKIIQDFPLRGKPGFLRVKKRKWQDKDTKESIFRDWNLVMEGTKLTKEFADFLKELDRE